MLDGVLMSGLPIEVGKIDETSHMRNGREESIGPSRASERLLAWFVAHGRALPWRETRDPYAILVSEVMLQQTQVAAVIPYYARFLDRFPTLAALAAATEQEVLQLWEGLGYYTRVRNMQRAAQIIVKEHDGEFPREFEAVLALPGIGRYTAGAICSILRYGSLASSLSKNGHDEIKEMTWGKAARKINKLYHELTTTA